MKHAIKQYMSKKFETKKKRNVFFMWIGYSLFVATVALWPNYTIQFLPVKLLIILVCLLIWLLLVVPFMTWYEVHYKEPTDEPS